MPQFRFKACVKCQGDLVIDDGDWICLQCGTYYYEGLGSGPAARDHGGGKVRRGPEGVTSIPENRPVATMGIFLASALTARGPVFN